ncbi:MAG TPA: SsrA-binding protein SmpB [Candidatus Kapabacteria bacterium]|nr:SsrA-binding protein SmpB [Candidatus Kapabacteria bacterium]
MEQKPESGKILVSNRKARHDYTVLEAMEAGIALQGTEVKSLRQGLGNLQDSYALIRNGEVWLVGAHISPYEQGSYANHNPTRDRRLLLHAKEIRKLIGKTKEKGLTLVPLKLYVKGRNIKVELALVRGKQLHDKREAIKERDVKRAIMRGEE